MNSFYNLLFWSNRITTGCALGAFNIALVLIFLCGWSALRLECYSLMFIVIIGLPLDRIDDSRSTDTTVEFVSIETAEKMGRMIHSYVNYCANAFTSLMLWKDTHLSLLFTVTLGFFAFIFRVFPMWFILFVVVNGLFAYTFANSSTNMAEDAAELGKLLRFTYTSFENMWDIVYEKTPKMKDYKNKNQ